MWNVSPLCFQSLFDPINPDKDTVKTRAWTRRERLDNEFWLIQKLAAIMEKANFQELPRSQVEKALAEHAAGEGVMVSQIDPLLRAHSPCIPLGLVPGIREHGPL